MPLSTATVWILDGNDASILNNMFYNAAKFNGDINHWDVSNITSMISMFYGNTIFNKSLNNWNVSSVTNMDYMFNSNSVFSQNLTSWSVNPQVIACTGFNNGSWTQIPAFANCTP
ncbi:MAG: BspA family leucine-rich repeat surface protein [Pseudobdellovibrio sp.]